MALGSAADVYVEFGPADEVDGGSVNVAFIGADVALGGGGGDCEGAGFCWIGGIGERGGGGVVGSGNYTEAIDLEEKLLATGNRQNMGLYIQKAYPAVTLNARKEGGHEGPGQQEQDFCSRLHFEM